LGVAFLAAAAGSPLAVAAPAWAGSVAVTATIPVGNNPRGVAVDPITGTVYVANFSDNTVSAISEATGKVTATIPVGTDPFAVWLGLTP
jgi:YVTN family beta-propeller protein